MAKRFAFTESSMPVFGESGMIGNLVFQTQLTKPAIRQVQVNFFAYPKKSVGAITP